MVMAANRSGSETVAGTITQSHKKTGTNGSFMAIKIEMTIGNIGLERRC